MACRTVALDGEEKAEEGCEEVTVAAQDEPGLFAKISGVLTANHWNILSAEISTWGNGVAVGMWEKNGFLRRANSPHTVPPGSASQFSGGEIAAIFLVTLPSKSIFPSPDS